MTRNPMTRVLAGRTFRVLLGLIALIEAVFLGDVFSSHMEAVFRNGGDVFDVWLLLILRMPEVIDFALPLTLLLGLYFAITAARDENELVVCAAAGVSWLRIPRFALTIGLAAFFVSLTFSGFVTPTAKYAHRLAVQHLAARLIFKQITEPTPNNSIREIKDRVVISTPPESDQSERGNLYIFEEDTGDGWRFSQADDWTVEGPGSDGGYSVHLQKFRDYLGRSARDDLEPLQDDGNFQRQVSNARITVSSLEFGFRLEELVAAIDKARLGNEQLLLPWNAIREVLGGSRDRGKIDRNFGEVIARASLCLFAALISVAAAAWSGTRSGRYPALPTGMIAVLAADVAARAILGDAGAAGPQAFMWAFGLVMAVGLAVPAAYIATRRETMIAPGRLQA